MNASRCVYGRDALKGAHVGRLSAHGMDGLLLKAQGREARQGQASVTLNSAKVGHWSEVILLAVMKREQKFIGCH